MLGASYGGYMALWILGHNEVTKFKAIVSHDGVFDTRNTFYTTDELYFPEAEFGGTPWTAAEGYSKYVLSSTVSPLTRHVKMESIQPRRKVVHPDAPHTRREGLSTSRRRIDRGVQRSPATRCAVPLRLLRVGEPLGPVEAQLASLAHGGAQVHRLVHCAMNCLDPVK